MVDIRRGLRGWTAALAIAQCASLSAFFPRDCCLAHGSRGAPHHAVEAPAPVSQQAADGHHAHGSSPGEADVLHAHSDQEDTPAPHEKCRLQGDCQGPLTTLTTVLSNQGMPLRAIAFLPDFRLVSRLPVPILTHTTVPLPPETPPPRI